MNDRLLLLSEVHPLDDVHEDLHRRLQALLLISLSRQGAHDLLRGYDRFQRQRQALLRQGTDMTAATFKVTAPSDAEAPVELHYLLACTANNRWVTAGELESRAGIATLPRDFDTGTLVRHSEPQNVEHSIVYSQHGIWFEVLHMRLPSRNRTTCISKRLTREWLVDQLRMWA